MATSIIPAVEPPAAAPSTPRRPFRGSCHCGKTKYIAFLQSPPVLCPEDRGKTIRIYKCNCTTCQKMSIFHVRLVDSPRDFYLLSPLDPESGGLGDYTCFAEDIHFYFCKTCGVRCFAMVGESVVEEVSVEEELGGVLKDEERKGAETVKVWRLKAEGWLEGKTYLSVNAATLDDGQEGLDLREWTEKGWIWYLEMRHNEQETRLKEPYVGGIY